jgi:hypothetical protein
MSEEVYMDVPAVRGIARNFGQMEDVLRVASRSMETAIATLKTTAFMGLVGGYAVATFLDRIKPVVDQYAAKCDEMENDLNASATAYQNGDARGSTRFF